MILHILRCSLYLFILISFVADNLHTTAQATSLCFRISMPCLSCRCHSLSSFAFSRNQAHQLFVADNLHILLGGDYHELNATNDSFMLLAGVTHHYCLMTQSRFLSTCCLTERSRISRRRGCIHVSFKTDDSFTQLWDMR